MKNETEMVCGQTQGQEVTHDTTATVTNGTQKYHKGGPNLTHTVVTGRTTKEEPEGDGGDSSPSSDEEYKHGVFRASGAGEPSRRAIRSPPRSTDLDDKEISTDDRGRDVSNILRACKGQPTFCGLYDEELEAVAESYEENSDSCDATDLEKSKEVFSMLSGSSGKWFNRKGKECGTVAEGVWLFRSWYNSKDKQ